MCVIQKDVVSKRAASLVNTELAGTPLVADVHTPMETGCLNIKNRIPTHHWSAFSHKDASTYHFKCGLRVLHWDKTM